MATAGKAPIAAANVFSFLLNRLFETWASEAAGLLHKATSKEIDAVSEEFSAPALLRDGRGRRHPAGARVHDPQDGRAAGLRPAPSHAVGRKVGVQQARTKVDVPRKRRIGSGCASWAPSSRPSKSRTGISARSDLNFGSVIALAYKKGIIDLMANLGADKIKDIMKRFDAERRLAEATKPVEQYFDFREDILVDRVDGVTILTIRRPQAATPSVTHLQRDPD